MTAQSAAIHALYRFWAADGTLLYIGLTMNPPTRFKAHSKDKEWWLLVASVTFEHFPTRDALVAAERAAIEQERPVHNVTYNRPPTPVPTPKVERPSRRKESNETPARALRVTDDLWREFADATARAGTKRSTVLVEFIRWTIRDPLSKLPARPPRRVKAD